MQLHLQRPRPSLALDLNITPFLPLSPLDLREADTTHLLDSFKDSLGTMVMASKEANDKIGELVRGVEDERREVANCLGRVGQSTPVLTSLVDVGTV